MSIPDRVDLGKIPSNVKSLGEVIRRKGLRAFLVGGAVRDLLLKRSPKDYDISVETVPSHLVAVFPEASTCGIEYGRICVHGVDVVCTRKESQYRDKRHPSLVEFGVPIEEDLQRRDFTVNAMAVDLETGALIDPCGGRDDLSSKILRVVGDAKTRFSEDAIRVMRAIRFKNELAFNYAPGLYEALCEAAPSLLLVSGERVFVEFKAILCLEDPYCAVIDLFDSGVIPLVFRDMRGVDIRKAARRVSLCAADPVTRFAALCYDLNKAVSTGTSGVEKILERFNVSSKFKEEVNWLCSAACAQSLIRLESGCGYWVRWVIKNRGRRDLERLLDLRIALWRETEDAVLPPALRDLLQGILESDKWPEEKYTKVCLTGKEIAEKLNLTHGPELGRLMAYLEDLVLRFPDLNEPETLIKEIESWRLKR